MIAMMAILIASIGESILTGRAEVQNQTSKLEPCVEGIALPAFLFWTMPILEGGGLCSYAFNPTTRQNRTEYVGTHDALDAALDYITDFAGMACPGDSGGDDYWLYRYHSVNSDYSSFDCLCGGASGGTFPTHYAAPPGYSPDLSDCAGMRGFIALLINCYQH